jgi:choline dehydrogenase-like flavoprotein
VAVVAADGVAEFGVLVTGLVPPGAAGERPGESAVALPRGKVIGGSSATSYAFAMRARPADHDEWPQLGLDG